MLDHSSTLSNSLNGTFIMRQLLGFFAVMMLTFSGVHAQEELSYIGNQDGINALQKELSRFDALAGGKLGISVIHLETGIAVDIHGDEAFPMASTNKVAVATNLLSNVDAGKMSLNEMITVKESELMPPKVGITKYFAYPGIVLSMRNLIESMLLISDNTATDVLIRYLGGPWMITKYVRKSGVDGLRLDRTFRDQGLDLGGVDESALDPYNGSLLAFYYDIPVEQRTGLVLKKLQEKEKQSKLQGESPVDLRDTATPKSMALLLSKIWKGELLSEKNTALLKDIMKRCETGEERIKGKLPPNTVVAHKTGSYGRSINDVGVITLPNGKGHLVVTIFIKDLTVMTEAGAMVAIGAMADAARTAYDFFVFNIKQK